MERNKRFTSYDRSQTAQLDYAVNRSYSSGQGRFTSVDPIGMGASDLISPQSLNLYAYVENNPIDFVDPSGLFKQPDKPQEPDWESFWRFILDSYERSYPIWVSHHEEAHGGGGITPLPGDLRDRVVDIANNCKDFMNKFFDQLSKFGKVFSRDFGALFDRVGSKNIFLKNQDKGIGGTAPTGFALTSPPREIPINPLIDTGVNPDTQEANFNNYAKTTMQELLHHSKDGKRETFTDQQLDMAAVKMLPEKDRPAALELVEQARKNHPKPGTYGGYAHGIVGQNCSPTNPYGPPPKKN